ncbi:MAG: hypothetical protein ACREMY_31530, partial [bacterium]
MRRNHIVTAILATLLMGILQAQAAEPDAKELGREVARGDLAQASIVCDHLIAQYEKLMATDAKGDSWKTLHSMEVGYYLAAKAQIFALKGDHQEAAQQLNTAEQYGTTHPEITGFLSGWEGVLEDTRAFLLEKKGATDAAATAYEHSDSEHAHARLALLALRSGDNAEARRWASKEPENPTALLVIGRVDEKGTTHADGKAAYDKAWQILQDSLVLGKNNEFLPIYFCEGTAITA